MFGQAWLYLVAATLIPALLLHQPALLLVSILLFLTGAMARVWDYYLFNGVEYSRTLNRQRVFFGEEVTLEVQVTNKKLLPLPWFRVEEEVPESMVFSEPSLPSSSPARRVLVMGLSLRWYTRVTRRYTAKCDRRGVFTFGPTKLEAGDLFGFFRRTQNLGKTDRLLVFPRIVPLSALRIPSKDLFGDVRVRRHISEDPVRVLGTREYVPTDPMKRIHWKATARVGRLQTKLLEPITSVDAAVFLDTRTVEPPYWGYMDQLLEMGVIVAASIATYAQQNDIKTGLYVNQTSPLLDRMIQIQPSRHTEQLPHILEALAQVHSQEIMPIARLVQVQARSLPWSTSIVVITAIPTPALLTTLTHFQRAGRRTTLVLIGRQAIAPRGGITTFRVDDQEAWQDVESIALEGRAV